MSKSTPQSQLLKIYQDLDNQAAQQLKKIATEDGYKPSCTKGCSNCCYLLTTTTFAEGLLLAERLLEDAEAFGLEHLLGKLRKSAEAHCFDGLTRITYFEKNIPCVFLHEKDGTCEVYGARPSCCRYHFAFSPPEQCSSKAPRHAKTVSPDFGKLEEYVWGFTQYVQQELKFGGPIPQVAPIPLMTLFCMKFLTQGKEESINAACEGLPNPEEWVMTYGRALFEEGGGTTPVEGGIAEALKEIQ